jgi:hypothetical protein
LIFFVDFSGELYSQINETMVQLEDRREYWTASKKVNEVKSTRPRGS